MARPAAPHRGALYNMTARKTTAAQIAKIYRVPYWLIDPDERRPSWIRRPLWRLRAWRWSRDNERSLTPSD